MNKLSQKRQKIIAIILEKGATRSSSIYSEMVKLEEDISLKRIRAAYYWAVLEIVKNWRQYLHPSWYGKINFVRENSAQFKTITKKNLEELHAILVKDLSVVGSAYRPLDNIYQIAEAVEALGRAISKISAPCAKALIVLLGISYVQPFEDGNKRTARLAANAVLLAYGLAPLSYRSVEEDDYREAMLVFYELNSIMPFQKIFIDQYKFATQNYAIK